MSEVTSEIPKVEITNHFVLQLSLLHTLFWFFLGYIGSYLFNLSIWMGNIVYLISGIVSLSVHMLGHTRIIGFWYQAHVIGHHVKTYPAKRFLSDTYIESPDLYSWTNIFMYVIGGIITVFGFNLVKYFTLKQNLGLGVYITILLLMENWIHNQFHLRNTFLNKYSWFKKMQWIHYLHHQKTMKHNYAMKDFWFDFLTGNFRSSL